MQMPKIFHLPSKPYKHATNNNSKKIAQLYAMLFAAIAASRRHGWIGRWCTTIAVI